MTRPMREWPQPSASVGDGVAAGARFERGRFDAGEIIDADYVTLDPQTRPVWHGSSSPSPAKPAPPAGIAVLRQEEATPQHEGGLRGGIAFWLAGFGLAAAVFWMSGGHALVGR